MSTFTPIKPRFCSDMCKNKPKYKMQEASGMCVTAVPSSNVLPVDFPDMLVETIQTKTHNRHEKQEF